MAITIKIKPKLAALILFGVIGLMGLPASSYADPPQPTQTPAETIDADTADDTATANTDESPSNESGAAKGCAAGAAIGTAVAPGVGTLAGCVIAGIWGWFW